MPDRRPYANRGVPRRVTTRRPGRQFPVAPFLVGIAVLMALGAAWAFNPFASSARLPGGVSSDAARAQPDTSIADAAHLADAALPTPVGNPTPAATPVRREEEEDLRVPEAVQ